MIISGRSDSRVLHTGLFGRKITTTGEEKRTIGKNHTHYSANDSPEAWGKLTLVHREIEPFLFEYNDETISSRWVSMIGIESSDF